MSQRRENSFAESMAPGRSGGSRGRGAGGRSGRDDRRAGRQRERKAVGKRRDENYKNFGFLLPKGIHEQVKYELMSPEIARRLEEECKEAGVRPGTYGRYGLSELADLLLRDWLNEVERSWKSG